MRKTAFTILGALLIAGSTVQAATASEHHVRAGRGYDRWDYRQAYNQLNEPFYAASQTRARRDIEDAGSDGRDRVWCSWADCSPRGIIRPMEVSS
jgi:hypothetical protein